MLLLQQYIGPHQALSMLASAATLTQLSTSKCSHMDLITTLQEIGPNSIALFHMEFSQLDSPAFSTLVELLPHLTQLVIHIVVNTTEPCFAQSGLANDQTLDDKVTDSIDFKVSSFFLELSNTPSLPPGLERLAISWECHCEDRSGRRKAEIPKFAQLRDTFVERAPRLVWVFFRGFYYQFEWQIAPDGMSKESIGVACLDSHKQRYGLESFWQR
ncbi:hypothetical protein C8R46DRAFT_1343081 [Mycena filopes]|nr:hypothetical protein C8R46DRAFT_1343081 [Mycena filopes]